MLLIFAHLWSLRHSWGLRAEPSDRELELIGFGLREQDRGEPEEAT